MKPSHKAKPKTVNTNWEFTDGSGTFEWKNPHTLNQLYFPLCNEAGMLSSVTPRLNGDAKTDLNSFLLLPVSVEDLHNTRSARNFWIYHDDIGAYSLSGNSAKQISTFFTDRDGVDTTIRGTFLAHTLIREDRRAGLTSEITLFCPATDDAVELMWIKLTNISNKGIGITPTTAIPIFGRSADNIRDHRHATSLMHRMQRYDYGVSIRPTIHHDERGHAPNETLYFVLAVAGDGETPCGQFPTVAEFIGEGGGFDWPKAVVENIEPYSEPPNRRDGMEAIGAMRFAETFIAPGGTKDYIVIAGITDIQETIPRCIERYGRTEKIEKALENNLTHWGERVNTISFNSGNNTFDQWMRWVALQPMLRKLYGCSFLPHHDYGRGGRGWRDLWQDCLALLLQNPDEVKPILVSNFAGVRLDGSNATIILKGEGNFAADRNKISRVWMDHGVWPLYTVKLYIDQTGDIDILLHENTYWKDHQIKRAQAVDRHWKPRDGNMQKAVDGKVYRGSLIEHMLVQHLTSFHNVGDFNNMKLEGADWNDQLDMAREKGESVPFTAFYGWNLITMAELLWEYQNQTQTDTIELFKELLMLTGCFEKVDYESPSQKRDRLSAYFNAVDEGFSGEKVDVAIDELANDLKEKGEWVLQHVRKNEWIDSKTGYGFFNGYYNNDGVRVDGDHEGATRMNLTAQTFAVMSGAADDGQVKRLYAAAGAILKDPFTKGYRLTTEFGPNTWNFGRGFALVYGEKETGAMFSHMAVMFMNSLYRRGFVKEGYEVLSSLYKLCTDTEKAKIYPGIPEYITHEGRGMYHYLTGSASWLLMTVLNQVFGIAGDYGSLRLSPKLVREQFDNKGRVAVIVRFRGKNLEIIYLNKNMKNYGEYRIDQVRVNGLDLDHELTTDGVRIARPALEKLAVGEVNKIEVVLV
jgi:cellobiose phosphorylase